MGRTTQGINMFSVLAVIFLPLVSPQVSSWWQLSSSWPFNLGLDNSLIAPQIDNNIVPGRYLLRHNKFDGLETVLEAYGVDEDSIAAIRAASIVTSIELSDDEAITISTSDIDSEDAANTVIFTPGAPTNISNPLNGETVEFTGTILSPTLVRTQSTGLQTNMVEIKTWQFSYGGVVVMTEIVKEEEMLSILASQVMVRVDEENKQILG